MRLGPRWVLTAAALFVPALPAAASPALNSGDYWSDVPLSPPAADLGQLGQCLATAAGERLGVAAAVLLVRPGVFVARESATIGLDEPGLFRRHHPLPDFATNLLSNERVLFVDAFTGTPVSVVSGDLRALGPSSFDRTLLWLLASVLRDGESRTFAHGGATGEEPLPSDPLFSLPAAPLEVAFRAAILPEFDGGDSDIERDAAAPTRVAVRNPEPGGLLLWSLAGAAGAAAGAAAWRRRTLAA